MPTAAEAPKGVSCKTGLSEVDRHDLDVEVIDPFVKPNMVACQSGQHHGAFEVIAC